jgi:5'-3' exonuclease
MKIILVDAMSHLRVRLENRERHLLRAILNEANMPNRMTIWVWDGYGGNDARRAIFPRYKTRPSTPNTTYLQLKMIRELLGHTNAWQAQLPGFEGDDVIAALVSTLDGEKEILTTDVDLTALGVKCIGTKSKIPADLVRLYKLCVGDASDTIPGIKGFGKETWAQVNHDDLQRLIDAVLANAPWDETLLPKRCTNWLKENSDQLKIMKQVLEPLPMSLEQISAALKKGTDNPQAREAILKEFIL